MKANELRIGNWVRCKIYNGNNDVIIPFAFQEYSYIHLFEPIPLTPEILEKAGFDVQTRTSYASGGKCFYNVYTKIPLIYNEIQDVWWILNNTMDNPPKHLHQLQNLYLALTGTELEINL